MKSLMIISKMQNALPPHNGLLPMAKGESQSETCELTGVRRVL
jgi:hypothetical protein